MLIYFFVYNLKCYKNNAKKESKNMIFNSKNIAINDSYFSQKQKEILKEEFKQLFSSLDLKYSEAYGQNVEYFDEVTIFIRLSNNNFALVFHYPDRPDNVDEVNYTQIHDLIEAIDDLGMSSYFEFIMDQKGLDYDYVAKILTENDDLFVFLNNVDLSLYEIQERSPNAWKDMNEINLNLFFMIRSIIQKIKV